MGGITDFVPFIIKSNSKNEVFLVAHDTCELEME